MLVQVCIHICLDSSYKFQAFGPPEEKCLHPNPFQLCFLFVSMARIQYNPIPIYILGFLKSLKGTCTLVLFFFTFNAFFLLIKKKKKIKGTSLV